MTPAEAKHWAISDEDAATLQEADREADEPDALSAAITIVLLLSSGVTGWLWLLIFGG